MEGEVERGQMNDDVELEEFLAKADAEATEHEAWLERSTVNLIQSFLWVGGVFFSATFRELDTGRCILTVGRKGHSSFISVYETGFNNSDLEGEAVHEHIRKALMEAADLYLRHLDKKKD